MTLAKRIQSACLRAGDYVLSRQSPRGGFCFYRSAFVDEPNLGDTHHAIAALALLHRKVPQPTRVLDFLRSVAPSNQPSDLYHRTTIACALGPGHVFDDDTRRRIRAVAIPLPPPSDSVALSGWLRRSALVAKLKQRFEPGADGAALARLVTSLLHDGGFGAGPNLIDTWTAIDTLQTCGAPLRLPGVSQFVDRLQIGNPLFDTAPAAGSSARGDVLWAGVRACRALGVPIRYAVDACEFVLACQSAHGGFANAPQELPDIESTYRGIEILLELKPAT